MKCTKKSVNANLPRLDYLKRSYVLHGYSGIMPRNASTLKSVWMDLDSTGKCTGISCYGYGDAMHERHYYDRSSDDVKVLDITEIITEWMSDYDLSRKGVIDAIVDMVNNTDVDI